jgi:hypothetical protein
MREKRGAEPTATTGRCHVPTPTSCRCHIPTEVDITVEPIELMRSVERRGDVEFRNSGYRIGVTDYIIVVVE